MINMAIILNSSIDEDNVQEVLDIVLNKYLESDDLVSSSKKLLKEKYNDYKKYVPYDDYPAKLHEGERVLTASQNREYMSGGHGGVTVNISSMTVRSESDIDSIADELYRRIRLANSNYSEVV